MEAPNAAGMALQIKWVYEAEAKVQRAKDALAAAEAELKQAQHVVYVNAARVYRDTNPDAVDWYQPLK